MKSKLWIVVWMGLASGALAFTYAEADRQAVASSEAGLWSKNGHRIVGEIAERYLSETARAAIASLIGPQSLAQVGNWADEIKSDPSWGYAGPWHYISVDDSLGVYPTGEARYRAATRQSQGNVIEAIKYFETLLRRPGDASERAIALKFLVHLVGDIHQPLHVGRTDDRGGNQISVRWFGQPRNLHSVWDREIVGSEELSYTEFADFIDQAPADSVAMWQHATCIDWMNESFALRNRVYDFGERNANIEEGDPANLSYEYIYHTLPIVKRRLLQGGVRLAALFNAIFEEKEDGATCDLPFIKETVRLKGAE